MEAAWEPPSGSWECVLFRELEEDEELDLDESPGGFLLLPSDPLELDECLCEEDSEVLLEEECC